METIKQKQHIIKRKIIILQKGISIPDLAKQIGYTRQGVSRLINGNFKSVTQTAALQDAISAALGVTKEDFWPEFYGEDRGNTVSHDATVAVAASAVNS